MVFDINKLICYGCCHSSTSADYPGKPSGERPCMFCIRNPDVKEGQTEYKVSVWYDGTKPVKLPMDCYHSLDMLDQIHGFIQDSKRLGRLKEKLKSFKYANDVMTIKQIKDIINGPEDWPVVMEKKESDTILLLQIAKNCYKWQFPLNNIKKGTKVKFETKNVGYIEEVGDDYINIVITDKELYNKLLPVPPMKHEIAIDHVMTLQNKIIG